MKRIHRGRRPAPVSATCLASLSAAVFASLTLGCGAADKASAVAGGGGGGGVDVGGPGGASGISPPGAQDFGLFRQILARGALPGPETLDAAGFFAEHKLDYPPPDCGDVLCLHAALGVMGNLIDGANCTMIQIGMSSPIRPEELERPPLHLVLALDTSGSMRGPPLDAVRTGLLAMLDHLRPEDRISLVRYSTEARVVLERVGLDERRRIETELAGLVATGGTNIYDGLYVAFELAERHRSAADETRVLLLSDGVATAGFTTRERIVGLAEARAREGFAITTIGVGTEFDVELMRSIGSLGAGQFYFLEDPAAVREVFTAEVRTMLVPVARDLELEVETTEGYVLRGGFGARDFRVESGLGRLAIPSLFLARRQRADDPIEGGRRGGGGALLVELAPRPGLDLGAGEVGAIRYAFTDARTGERVDRTIEIASPLAPGETPVRGHFSDDTVGKGFVMLNVFVGLRLAATLASDADVGAARGVLAALALGLEAWLADRPDPDLADDLEIVRQFESVLARQPQQTPVRAPPTPFPAD